MDILILSLISIKVGINMHCSFWNILHAMYYLEWNQIDLEFILKIVSLNKQCSQTHRKMKSTIVIMLPVSIKDELFISRIFLQVLPTEISDVADAT